MRKPRKTWTLSPTNLFEFVQSTDFAKAILMAIALLVPIIIGVQYDILKIGIHIAIGAFFISPSDVSGSFRLKIKGLVLSVFLVLSVTLIAHYIKGPLWPRTLWMGALVFGLSYISVFGFRASLISFSGLFALALSSASFAESDLTIWQRLLFIGIGGVWYIALAFLRHIVFPKGPTEYYLAFTLKRTADYIDVRRKLIESEDRGEHVKELFKIQTELIDTHETLRELLITSRKSSGKSNYAAKRILVFSQLVDILELAMANPMDYNKTDQFFETRPDIKATFQRLLIAMSSSIRQLGQELTKIKSPYGNDEVEIYLEELERNVQEIKAQVNDDFNEELLLFSHILKYQKNQAKKIKKIDWIIRKPNQKELNRAKKRDYRRFLTQEKYSFTILLDNFNLNSTIFRHSLRISFAVMVGVVVGSFLEVLNGYWITLTLIVILRPNYGLTKERFKHRTIGTLIGGISGYIVILLTQNPTLIAVLAILSFVIGTSMIQRNYKTAAAFITIQVLFIYALIVPNALDFAQYRVYDTLIGAGIAALVNLLILPSWESKSLDKTLLNVLHDNNAYLGEIAKYYNVKGKLPAGYKVARKKAFLAMSDLSSSFQRMAQEPKEQQKELGKLYVLAMLNNSFLASLASISTYIISNPTTPASKNFNEVVHTIQQNLSLSEELLKHKEKTVDKSFLDHDVIAETYGRDLSKIKLGEADDEEEATNLKEEAFLILAQLSWLYEMSKKIPKLLLELNVEPKS